jgi:hypothetical protein
MSISLATRGVISNFTSTSIATRGIISTFTRLNYIGYPIFSADYIGEISFIAGEPDVIPAIPSPLLNKIIAPKQKSKMPVIPNKNTYYAYPESNI